MKSIKSLYSIIRLVLFISLLVFPNSSGKNDKHRPYKIEHQGSRGTWKILVQKDSPVGDISGKMVIELERSDAMERWYINISEDAAILFQKNESGDLEEAARIPVRR